MLWPFRKVGPYLSQIVWSLDEQKPLQAAKLKDEAELEGLLYAHIELLNPN